MKFTFGEMIRNLREDMDLSQAELGKEVNMTQRKISYLECGRNSPNTDDIRALCLYFKVSADYLLGLPKNLKHPDR